MKYYCRLHNDNTFATMTANIAVAFSPANIPLAMIRRFARGKLAYLLAYHNGLDIIKADACLITMSQLKWMLNKKRCIFHLAGMHPV